MKLDSVIKTIENEIGELGRTDNDGLFFEGKKDVNKVFFAVDPTLSTINKAIEQKSDLLVTHHWINSKPISRITSPVLNQALKALSKADMSLACYHLMWDFSRNEGNFLYLASLLNVKNPKWITKYEKIDGVTVVGDLNKEMDLEELAQDINDRLSSPAIKVYRHNPARFQKVAVSTGGGTKDFLLNDIHKENIITYITGEPDHTGVLYARDLGINLICLGHYWTEMLGMKNLMNKVEPKLENVVVSFIEDKGGC